MGATSSPKLSMFKNNSRLRSKMEKEVPGMTKTPSIGSGSIKNVSKDNIHDFSKSSRLLSNDASKESVEEKFEILYEEIEKMRNEEIPKQFKKLNSDWNSNIELLEAKVKNYAKSQTEKHVKPMKEINTKQIAIKTGFESLSNFVNSIAEKVNLI